MLTRHLSSIACYRHGHRLVGVLTLLVYVAMTIGLPVGYTGPIECNCECSASIKSAGKCCCHRARTDSSTKSCCASNAVAATTHAVAATTHCPANSNISVCAPAGVCLTEIQSCCARHTENQGQEDASSYCGETIPSSADAHETFPVSSSDDEEHPMVSSCGCGGSAPSGLLNSNEPRILFPRPCAVTGPELVWSLFVSIETPPERNLPPETPPPEAV